MTAIRRTFALGLAMLLAAATAVADTVITADEVISGRVVSAGLDSIRLLLPGPRTGILSTRDIYEIRLSDSGRVAELEARLPGLKITLDSGQYVPSPAVRYRERMQLRLDQARRAQAENLPGHADAVDTLVRNAAPAVMAARCRDMDAVLRECGRSDGTVAELLREVRREQEALRVIWPGWRTCLSSCLVGGGAGSVIGILVGEAIRPTVSGYFGGPDMYIPCIAPGGGFVGGPIGLVAGSVIGMPIGAVLRANLLARHRSRVNELIRRANRVVASPP